VHHTQLIHELLEQGKLRLSTTLQGRVPTTTRVTWGSQRRLDAPRGLEAFQAWRSWR
jgi:hypothetical protein